MDQDFFTTISPILNITLIVAAVVLYFMKGGNNASNEAITTYKSAVDAYEVRLKQTTDDNQNLQKEMTLLKERHRVEIDSVHQDVEKLRLLMQEQEKKYQAILVEKDKQIANITLILQNRNPESQSVTEAAARFMEEKGAQIDEIYKATVKKQA